MDNPLPFVFKLEIIAVLVTTTVMKCTIILELIQL